MLSVTSVNFASSFGTKAVESTLHQNPCIFTPDKNIKKEEFNLHLNAFAFVCAGKVSKHGA